MKRTVCKDFGGLTDGLKWKRTENSQKCPFSFHTSVGRLVFEIMSYTLVYRVMQFYISFVQMVSQCLPNKEIIS